MHDMVSRNAHLLKGHPVQDHLRASRDLLHREHIHAHAEPVQQLRSELAFLQQP